MTAARARRRCKGGNLNDFFLCFGVAVLRQRRARLPPPRPATMCQFLRRGGARAGGEFSLLPSDIRSATRPDARQSFGKKLSLSGQQAIKDSWPPSRRQLPHGIASLQLPAFDAALILASLARLLGIGPDHDDHWNGREREREERERRFRHPQCNGRARGQVASGQSVAVCILGSI